MTFWKCFPLIVLLQVFDGDGVLPQDGCAGRDELRRAIESRKREGGEESSDLTSAANDIKGRQLT